MARRTRRACPQGYRRSRALATPAGSGPQGGAGEANCQELSGTGTPGLNKFEQRVLQSLPIFVLDSAVDFSAYLPGWCFQ